MFWVNNEGMVIKQGSRVKVDYIGMLEDGTVFDTSIENIAKENKLFNANRKYEPLEIEIGKGQLIKGFENALINMKKGEEKEVKINPDEAYGVWNEKMVQEVDKSVFGDKEIKKGSVVLMSVNQQPRPAKVLEVVDKVKLDFNHPLAGKVLVFKIKVVDVSSGKKD